MPVSIFWGYRQVGLVISWCDVYHIGVRAGWTDPLWPAVEGLYETEDD